MSSPSHRSVYAPSSGSIQHISTDIQHTIELKFDAEIKDMPSENWCERVANNAGIVRRSALEKKIYDLPDSRAVYKMSYCVFDHKTDDDGTYPDMRSITIWIFGGQKLVKASWLIKQVSRCTTNVDQGRETVMLEEGNSTTSDNFKTTFLSSSNAIKFSIDLRGSKKTWDDSERMDQEPRWDDKEKIDHVTGTVELTFEPIVCKRKTLKRSLSNDLNYSKLAKKDEDFTILCKDKPFCFNQLYLSMISPVFERMQEEPFVESHHKVVKIEDFEPETLQSFKNIIYDRSIDEKDLTPQLLMFADKYDIQPLYKICHRHIMETFTKENYLDRIRECYLLSDNQAILTKAAHFVKENLGKFEESPELIEFMEENPKCWTKIIQLMMLKK